MNKVRLQKIAAIRTELDGLLSEEQGYLDAMPESLQDGERAAASVDQIVC